jgi:hypothetical protein
MKKKRPDPKKLLAKHRKQQSKKKPEGNPDGQIFSRFAFLKEMTFARQSYAALFALITVIDHRWQLGGINKFLTVTDFGAVAIGIRPVRRRSGDSATSPRGNDAG